MATASPQHSIEELVTCPICMERMKDPKHLYCQHAFCAQCLQDWTMQPGNPKGAIVCPICRKKTPIRKGIRSLPTHIGVSSLLDMLEDQQQKESKFQGFACGIGDTTCTDVVAFCESCGYHLCNGCLDKHLQDQTLWPHLLYIDSTCCIQHSSKVQNMYCHDCEEVGCAECVQEQHLDHDTADLAEVAKSNRAIMLNLCQSLQDIMSFAQKQPDMISVYALERKFEELKQQIDSHTRRSHKMLVIWEKAILADLKLKRERLGEEVCELEEKMCKGDSLVSFMKRFLQEGSDFQLVTAFSATSQRLHKATDSLNHVARRERNDDYDLAFVGQPIPESYGSLMGPKDTMSCTQGEDCQKDASTQAPTLTLPANSFCSSSSQTSAPAKSVCSSSSQTTHSGEIPQSPAASHSPQIQPAASGYIPPHRKINPKSMEFDASKWSGQLAVVDSMDLHEKESPVTERSHKVKGFFQWLQGTKDEDLEAPVTVFMCNKTGYLYIGEAGWWSDGKLGRVHSCTDLIYSEGNVMTNVSTTSVAVSPVDGTIAACIGKAYIALHKYGDIPRVRERESIQYDTYDFTTVRQPYGIAISDNHWVVVDKRNCVVRICTYSDGTATHLLTFGSRGSAPRQFCEPSHVCCDSLRDRFIVSDTGNNRIQVFDMSGDYLWEAGQFGSRLQTLNRPRGLCVDGPGNIIVADSANHRIVVLGWEKGEYLREIPVAIIPHSVTVDGRDGNVAYLVIAGLRGKMPVIQTREFVSPSFKYRSSNYRYRDDFDMFH